MKKNILFISNVKTPDKKLSSTDIMTNNIIFGLSQMNINLTLILLVNSTDDINSIKEYFSRYTDKIFFLPRFFDDNQSKYKFVFGSLFYLYVKRKYKIIAENIMNNINSVDLIISNKVTIDEIIYGYIFKKKYRNSLYYQYWSDPMALSGMTQLIYNKTPRRWIFRFIENKSLSLCDLIIYGTKTLCQTQSRFFPIFSDKMKYIDVCFTEKQNNLSINQNKENRILYAGNYFSAIRDLVPLLEAISEIDNIYLDIYGNGDIDLTLYKNVVKHQRIDRNLLEQIENEYNISICVLNKNTSQIPGKIFYDMYSPKLILVLIDGPMQKDIINYLKKYKRFLLCNNVKEEIKSCLLKRYDNVVDYHFIQEKFSPLAIAKSLVNGGYDLNN